MVAVDFIPRARRVAVIVLLAAPLIGILTLPGCPAADGATPSGTLYKRDVSKGIHDTSPPRGPVQALAIHRDGDAFACSTCHEGFTGELGQQSLEDEHKNIAFDHGSNSSCLNCHNPKNSDTYVDYSGNEIPADQPTTLCKKCHGPQFREWESGIHGRSNGHWDAKYGERVKLECVQCHDPHKPRFAAMQPRPAPRLTRFDLQPAGGAPHE